MNSYMFKPDIMITPPINSDLIIVRAEKDKIHFMIVSISKNGGYKILGERTEKGSIGFILKEKLAALEVDNGN